MRILLDECVDEALHHHLIGHECQTCGYAGFSGLDNGRLLLAAEQAGFEVLITVDQNMPHQQTMRNRRISLLILRAPATNLEDLSALVPQALEKLVSLLTGSVLIVGDR